MTSTASNSTAPSLRATNPRIYSLSGIRIVSTGSFVPSNAVRNEDLASLGCDADWIIQRTGIRERRHAPSEMATSDMATAAAKECIQRVDAKSDEIDLLIVATMTPDSPIPSTACMVQERLGIDAPAMDLNAACSGFVYAMITAMQFVQSGASQLALVVGADKNSLIVNPDSKKTYPLFGDGAGAVLIGSRADGEGQVTYTLGADGTGWDLLHVPAGGSRLPMTPDILGTDEQYLKMDGRSVFKWAVRLVADTIKNVTQRAGIAIDDLDHVVLHQANLRIIDAVAEQLGVPREKLVINLDRFGNTSAASIPIGLHEAAAAGRFNEGDLILMCGFGAGLTWGTAIVSW